MPDRDIDIKCDNALKVFYEKTYAPHSPFGLCLELGELYPKITEEEGSDLISILYADGMIDFVPNHRLEKYYEINNKGINFYRTSSYVERQKSQNTEILMKEHLYKYRWVTWLISFAALVVSIIALCTKGCTKNESRQILLLPAQEMKKELPIPDTLRMWDSLYEKKT